MSFCVPPACEYVNPGDFSARRIRLLPALFNSLGFILWTLLLRGLFPKFTSWPKVAVRVLVIPSPLYPAPTVCQNFDLWDLS